MKAIQRAVLPLILCLAVLIFLALVIGDNMSGERVHAFTDNSYKTHSIYVFDTQHGIYFYIEIFGHEDELPGWSTRVRGVVYYPRKP
jgi:hypothetical protein